MGNLFKRLDNYLFSIVDNIKTHPEYLKIVEKLSSLDDQYKVIINQSVSFFLIFCPLIIVFIVFLQNSSLKSHKEAKFNILALSQYIIEQNTELNRAGIQHSTTSPIGDQGAFTSSFQNALRISGVPGNLFSVQEFRLGKTGMIFQTVESTVFFKDVTLSIFSNALKALEKGLKARFLDFEVNRDKSGQYLSGKFNILVVGKSNGK